MKKLIEGIKHYWEHEDWDEIWIWTSPIFWVYIVIDMIISLIYYLWRLSLITTWWNYFFILPHKETELLKAILEDFDEWEDKAGASKYQKWLFRLCRDKAFSLLRKRGVEFTYKGKYYQGK